MHQTARRAKLLESNSFNVKLIPFASIGEHPIGDTDALAPWFGGASSGFNASNESRSQAAKKALKPFRIAASQRVGLLRRATAHGVAHLWAAVRRGSWWKP
jgi:hypothetical protein